MSKLTTHCTKAAASMMLAALLLGAAGAGNLAQAAPFPYSNDFTSTGLTNMAEQFTLDTGNGVLNLNHPLEGGTLATVASEGITGIGTSDFVMSTQFTVNEIEGTGNAVTAGFGAFSLADTLNSSDGQYYLVDWRLGGGGDETQMGSLRILRFEADGSNTPIATGGNAGIAVAGETYELRLTGSFTGGALDMTFTVFDEAGVQLGTNVSGTDSAPINGEFFGLRNRTAGNDHLLDIDFHNFSVASPSTAVPGDFDGDGDVDGADFVVWQTNFPTQTGATLATGDADGDGDVDGADFVIWQTNFPFTPSGSVAPVPEPQAFVLAAMGGVVAIVLRRRFRHVSQ